MADFELMKLLNQKNKKKIVLLVMDGLGGIPMEPKGHTALEHSKTPNMDKLAAEGALGQIVTVRPGITPGSGPAHLSLFGYDPVQFEVGRGVLESTGIGMKINAGDVTARGNFCTVDEDGLIIDRRAGRISTEEAKPICEKLNTITIPGVSVEVRHVKEYRFAVVIRGDGLEAEIEDTDPQKTGIETLPAVARDPGSQKAADLYNEWLKKAREVLKHEPKANACTLRGFSTDPGLPQFKDAYGLTAACVAVYPMYKGVSSLVGMDIRTFAGDKPADEFAETARIWDQYDFFFIHIKKTDSAGEDGNFETKVHVIESVDEALPDLMTLKPDVLAITGDHSTPCKMKSHSWHPVPFLLWAPETIRPDDQSQFGETWCTRGNLGTFPGTDILPILLGHAGKLKKFGA
ncbi:MAG: 2,3-bisphosphoglycerate-independent phosphoglycerate mutase [Anaerolineales bacterium]|nr:2,3-bisphosphoglycerate-independent phosphoglycerate mutase [Anaerolineales bacterium]